MTGSKFLIEYDDHRVLVDCGLFQGPRELRAENWADGSVDPSSIDSIIITHAHLDHCGHLPRLVRAGFSGPVHVTYDTGRLMAVVLPDSGRLLEEEAKYANKVGYSRHSPALPLYTEEDAWRSLDLLSPVPFSTEVELAPGITARFEIAGHILGSSCVHVQVGPDIALTFSGDLGRDQHPLLVPPTVAGDSDWILVESTYGDREHRDDDTVERLGALIERTIARGGMVVIPAFAVDRTEVLLYHLRQLHEAGALPDVPIYLDSPMALAALQVYRDAIIESADDVRTDLHRDEDLFDLANLHEVPDTEGSKAISRRVEPAIIIAGAGMASGGRVVHHLTKYLPDARNSVALVGFQAQGTRGRQLLDGATSVKIHGRYVPVRAEICDLAGFSVHADADELLTWLGTATREPSGVFVVHGEPDAAAALQRRIIDELGWNAVVPFPRERLRIDTAA